MPKVETESEPSRKNEWRYPYNVLRTCLKVGEAVRNHGGERASVPKSVLAQELGMEQGASSFGQLVASAKTFGIVNGISELRLTDISREYFFPVEENGARNAELDFFAKPNTYKYLIDEFDGSRLPSIQILANHLGRHCSVPESWRDRVATMFVSTAKELGIVDANSCLRYGAAKHAARSAANSGSQTAKEDAEGSQANERQTLADVLRAANLGKTPLNQPNDETNVWVFSEGGGTVRLHTTDPLPRSLWERLKRYVEVLEPSD